MSFFAMVILVFVLMRFMRPFRMRQWHCGGQFAWHDRRPRGLHYSPPGEPPAAVQPSPFEALKERYVRGALSDAQYEAELDRLIRLRQI